MTARNHNLTNPAIRSSRVGAALLTVVIVAAAPGGAARAASVRVWATAIVVANDVHLNDVCELRGFDPDVERALRQAIVMPAPAPGETLTLLQAKIRDAVRAAGANMAFVTIGGAARCEVSRPSQAVADAPRANAGGAGSQTNGRPDKPLTRQAAPPSQDHQTRNVSTLRTAVVEFFDSELRRYRGSADVTFDRSTEQLLELTSPPYTFRVRRRGGAPLGLVAVEVDVLSGGSVVQTVPLAVQVFMTRDVVVARRSINQGATIGLKDVETTELRFDRVEQIGLLDATRIIGQRAKRFVSSGSMIDLADVESVPIVVRGQLITLVSVAGGVEVVTTAKAAGDGLYGDTIKVRAVDNRRVEFDAVVIGPARARVGRSAPTLQTPVSLVKVGS